MCNMRELVVVVEDARLGAPWAAARATDGQRVVFIREDSQHLIGDYCAAGPGACPIFAALVA